MRMIEILCVLVGLVFGVGGSAWAVSATQAEKDLMASALSHADGVQFSFVYDGRPCSEMLGRCKRDESSSRLREGVLQTVVTFSDPQTSLKLRYTRIAYEGEAAAEWLLELENAGMQDTPLIEAIRPYDVAIRRDDDKASCTLRHALGDSNSANSFAPVEHVLRPEDRDEYVLAPNGGRSSDGQMPFFNVETGRRQGRVIAIGWSGQWEARFQRVNPSEVRVQCGMQTMRLRLHPGETIRTPRVLVQFWEGDDPVRGDNLFRQQLMKHYLPRRNGELVFPPICASVTETDPDGSYEVPHIRVMEPLASRGIEVFWSDMDPQQWYPGGFPNGTGTWEPDPAKYPRGLQPIGDAAKAAGLQYLLWFEPERVASGSRIAKEHPDWVTGGEGGGLFKLHIPEARRWLTDYIDVQVAAARLDWIRWDFNIEPLKYWQQNDVPDRQGMTEIRHIEGLYAMWDDLMKRHPGLVIDLCASGGRRIDIESLKRGLPLWHSDLQCSGPHPAADQLQNGGLFRWVPLHGCGAFAYEPWYVFRSAMTAGNILAVSGARGPLGTADLETEDQVKRSVAIFKKIRPYMLGDFHPLFPHSAGEDVWYGYQFHRADLDAGCAIVFRREKNTASTMNVALKGVVPTGEYEVTFEDVPEKQRVPGSALAEFPVTISTAPGSAIVYYRKATP